MSTGAKWVLGIGGTLGTLATIALLIKKNKYSEAKQLAENITFEKAKAIEEQKKLRGKMFKIFDQDNIG